jgi:hypothetical protein
MEIKVKHCFADLVCSARNMPVACKQHAPAAQRLTAQKQLDGKLIIERLTFFTIKFRDGSRLVVEEKAPNAVNCRGSPIL